MKNIVILGAGTAGTLMANKLVKSLDSKQWAITIVDELTTHYYQPGFLFIPFGIYKEKDVIKSTAQFIPKGVNLLNEKIGIIEADRNRVKLDSGKELNYDILLIATGTHPRPDQTPGLKGDLWYKKIFDFYTFEGSVALAKALDNFKGGKLVVNVAEMPIKCPIAPLEFLFLADSYFRKRKLRDKVEIIYATPLSGAFTKPIAASFLGGLLEQKNIKVVPDFNLESVDNEGSKILSYDGREQEFDLLVSVPLNMGAQVIADSGLGDDLNYVPTDKHTLRSKNFENIFILGDATDIPASKAGSVVHFASEILFENMMSYINGKPMSAAFDGHANCFIEAGDGKATLIDFNYETEPLPGVFPMAGVGPLGLLKVNRLNHWGKLAFKWIYWNMLLRGREIPMVPSHMKMTGKKISNVKM